MSAPTTLPPGATVFVFSGGFSYPDVRDTEMVVRIQAAADGTLRRQNLTAFVSQLQSPDPAQPWTPFVWSWASDDSGREMYATICLGAAGSCGCSTQRRSGPGALLFASTDSGVTWTNLGEIPTNEHAIGVDRAGAVLGSQSGCSTPGPYYQWREPGHVPILAPHFVQRDAPGPFFAQVPGVGWLWISGRLANAWADGSPFLSPSPDPNDYVRPVAGDPAGVYSRVAGGWQSYSETDTYLIHASPAGTINGVWRLNARVLIDGLVGRGVLVGSISSVISGDPDPRRQNESIPVLIDLNAGTIRPIVGVAAGKGEPMVRPLRAIVD